jgi:hypothetical protein
MICATFSTQQQQKIDEIVREIMFIKTYYITNDSHGYLLLLGQQCYAYHASHTHIRAVAVSRSFGRPQYLFTQRVCGKFTSDKSVTKKLKEGMKPINEFYASPFHFLRDVYPVDQRAAQL